MVLVPLVVLVLLVLAADAGPSYALTPVTHYNCPNDNSNNGHYVPANYYWEQEFTSQGTSITGGFLLLGANVGDHDHTARIGIYTGSNRSGALEEIEQQVVGYGGVHFTFPTPITVSPGQQLHIAATGVGDFTTYDELTNGVDGCFIGRIEGYTASSTEQSAPAAEQSSPPPTEQHSTPAPPTSPAPSPLPGSVAAPIRRPFHTGIATGNERRTLAELIAESRFVPSHLSHNWIVTMGSPLTETVSMNLAHGISLSAQGAPRLLIVPDEHSGLGAGVVAPGLVLFHSTARETNTAVQLLGSRGLRIFEVLRGPKAPHRFSFSFHLPTNTYLVRATGGRAQVQTTRGHVIYGIAAPWAFDKSGHHIQTYYSVSSGNRLVLHIAAKRAAYPIVVDPGIMDVVLDAVAWIAERGLKQLNQQINIEPAICKFTGIACKETVYAPSDQDVKQLGLSSGPAPQPSSTGTGIQTLTPDGSGGQQPPSPGQAESQYECPNDYSNIGIYVTTGHYWHNNFVAQAGVITGGSVGLGANSDGHNHTAEVGIYSDPGLTRPLGVVSVNVSGYGGVRFSFTHPIPVAAGEELYFGVRGVGDFTVYDNRTGCMIGDLEGDS